MSTAFRASGEGPRLLQIHGLGTGHKNFDLLTPRLGSRLRVIDIDLPGYGESEERKGPRSIQGFAEDTAQFIQAADIGPVSVHGTSMGGCVAMALAARHPGLVNRLVLTCTLGRGDNAASALWSTWRTAGRAGAAALAELTAVQGFSRQFWDQPEALETKETFFEALASTTPAAFLRDLVALEQVDLEADLGRIECETLLIGATQDVITPIQASSSGLGMTDLQRLIPRATLVVFDRCGHFISLERPADTAEAIAEFVLHGPPATAGS